MAERLSEDPDRADVVAQLLESNWRPGDSRILCRLLLIGSWPTILHSVGHSILDLAEKHPDPELNDALTALYELGPCSFCRGSAVRQLLLGGALPPALAEECRFDANLEIRKVGPGE